MADRPQNPHAIFIPYPLQGHVIPSVHLAINLASQGFTITFINTQFIHHRTCKSGPNAGPDIFAGVRESGLDIRYTTVSDGLPVEFDRSLNHRQYMATLLDVFSAHVEEAVARIVESGEKVHLLIADTYFVWPSKVAKKFGLFYVSFWTEAALVFSLYYHLDLLRINGHFACPDPRRDTIEYIPGVRAIKPKDMTSYLQETDASSISHQIIFKAFEDVKEADFVLCNTIAELETETIAALHVKKPFYAIGPMFPSGFTKSIVPTSLWSESDCTQWLNSKPHGSVLYVSFGSYAHVSKRDLVEIARGLAFSKVSFLWALRPDMVSSDDADPLPARFRKEVDDRSMVIPWCSQITVLTHPAIGGFLTHCGWNSVLEAIWSEIPLLCFPLLTDQFPNRKLVVDDWKIGINLTDENLIVTQEVSKNINSLMSGKSRENLQKAMKEVRKILENASAPNGSSERNMKQFIRDLMAKIQKEDVGPDGHGT